MGICTFTWSHFNKHPAPAIFIYCYCIRHNSYSPVCLGNHEPQMYKCEMFCLDTIMGTFMDANSHKILNHFHNIYSYPS
ncbi:hypothetical protein XENTR_v10005237 [Xenopus tropicalis]|nr:hypothetical protein XENTR_v10005237 [Xenopus tropicalis]